MGVFWNRNGHLISVWSFDWQNSRNGLVFRNEKSIPGIPTSSWNTLEYIGIFPGFFSAHADWSQSSRGRGWGPSECLHPTQLCCTCRSTSRRWCLLAIFWTSCSCELGVVSLRLRSCILHHGHVKCYCWYAWKFQLWWCAVCLVCGVDLCAMPAEYPFPLHK